MNSNSIIIDENVYNFRYYDKNVTDQRKTIIKTIRNIIICQKQ